MSGPLRTKPEILAPAGAPECLPAAVAGGADAVYLGLRHFNARGRAANFRSDALADHVAYLHAHGLKCYVVLNTLLHDDEYPKAIGLASAAVEAGVDAAIIQDLGLWTTLARELPELERHASTQMTVHDPAQVDVLAGLGATRVILARELAQRELQACTDRAAALGIETEHFVHGALCYAFSGQCLISNFAGCRSANRGTCAQNCRFEYSSDLGTDTQLSMKDLSLIAHVPAMAEMGVASLKIEGRLKGPEYVFAVSRLYRQAVDAWADGQPFAANQANDLLRGVFSRGFTDAPLAGRYGDDSRVHRADPESDAGRDASIVHVDREAGRVELRCASAPEPGQGYRFAVGAFTDGFLVTAVERLTEGVWRCRVRIQRRGPFVPPETACHLNSDHRWHREAGEAMRAVPLEAVRRRHVLAVRVSGAAGQPLSVELRWRGRALRVDSDLALQAAESKALDEAQLRDKMGAFGDAPYVLGAIDWAVQGAVFVPASALKRLRRSLVSQLESVAAEPRTAFVMPEPGTATQRSTALWVAVADEMQARAALDAGANAVWLDGLDLFASEAPRVSDLAGLWIRHPAVAQTSPWIAAMGLPVVAGHLGTLARAHEAGLPVMADHHCNAYGVASLAALGDLGAQGAVISLECSSREVARIAGRAGGLALPKLALTVHGRVPAMETRQDHGLAVGATRGLEASEREGGLPYQLERRPGGVTVLWEQRQLCAPEQALLSRGLVDAWVLELAGEHDAAAVVALVGTYRDLLSGAVEAFQVSEYMRLRYPGGVFPGHLKRGARELDDVVRDE